MNDTLTKFRRLCDKRELLAFLNDAPEGRRVPQLHPLGFLVFLVHADESSAIRLHYWPPQATVQQSGYEIHDHQYDLDSHILAGQFRQNEFRVFSDGACTHAVYRVDYSGKTSKLLKTVKLVRAERTRVVTLSAGDNYSLRAGELHQVEALGKRGSLTIAMTRQASGQARVLGPVDGSGALEFHRLKAGPTEARSALMSLRKLLEH